MAPQIWYLVDDQPEAVTDQTELAVYLARIEYLRPYWPEMSSKLEPLFRLSESDVWEWTERCARCYWIVNLCWESAELRIRFDHGFTEYNRPW